jgi:hypothetical protein
MTSRTFPLPGLTFWSSVGRFAPNESAQTSAYHPETKVTLIVVLDDGRQDCFWWAILDDEVIDQDFGFPDVAEAKRDAEAALERFIADLASARALPLNELRDRRDWTHNEICTREEEICALSVRRSAMHQVMSERAAAPYSGTAERMGDPERFSHELASARALPDNVLRGRRDATHRDICQRVQQVRPLRVRRIALDLVLLEWVESRTDNVIAFRAGGRRRRATGRRA